ncbi:hypothetical protein ACET3X_001386 [Alternaria dauci]|uniref:Opioid growth factor receptor (OGFr) conserved domain-containing protein n=1 Tax=Alternaria dauci TaxID=48095 RepID=A0ABR3UYY8_9PLEO
MGPTKATKAAQPPAQGKSHFIIRFYDPDVYAKDALNRQLHQILAWTDQRLESSHNYIQILFPLPEGSPFNMEAPVINLEVMQAFHSRSELRQGLRQSFQRMLSFYGFKESTKPEEELQEEQGETKASGFKAAGRGVVGAPLSSELDAKLQPTENDGDSTPATGGATEGLVTNPSPDRPVDADVSVWKGKDRAPRADESFSSISSSYTNVSTSTPLPYHIVRTPDSRKKFAKWAVRFDHNHLRITRILRSLRVLGLEKEYKAFFAALERAYDDPMTSISEQSMGFWRSAIDNPLYLAPDGKKCKWLMDLEKESGNLKRKIEE